MLRNLLVAAGAAALLACAGASHAAIFKFDAAMDGANENPSNASPAVGFTIVTLDDVLNQLTVDVTWEGLIGGNAGAAHIHCCIAMGSNVNVAVPFTGFPAATGGTYHHVFDLTQLATYNGLFVTNFGGGTVSGAHTALVNGLFAGQAYSNIHDSQFVGGEIRGFLTPVPEPSVWALMIAGFGMAGAALRSRRRLAMA
jgi:hypothetical protein